MHRLTKAPPPSTRSQRLPALLALLCAGLIAPTIAQPLAWPDRHGPHLDGTVCPADTKPFPTEWSAEKNIAWKAKLHAEGHSSPVVGEGRIWLTIASPDGTKQGILCFDEATGNELHDKPLFHNPEPESLGGAAGFNNYAAPSCVLEPGAVYVHFGSYGTARLDAETAKVVWQRRDLECRHFRGPGSSPVLFEDLLILTFDGVDHQYTTALDKATGKTVWRTARTTDYGDLDDDGKPHRDGDMRKAYCTPGFATVGDQTQLLSVGSRAMQAYDVRTGKERWTVRHKSYNAAIRPIWLEKEGLVLINTGSRGAELIAIRLDETTKGDVTESHIAWKRSKANPRFAMPIYKDGLLFQTTDIGVVSCVDAATGEEVWQSRIKGRFRASPVLAGDHLYFFSEHGLGSILHAGREFKEVAVNRLDAAGTTACPAFANGAIYVRGKDELFKISATP